MKLLHDVNSELSRTLLATLPAGATVIEGAGGYPVSAYPSVVVDIPVQEVEAPAYGPNGELLGVQLTTIPAHEEVLRMPMSWQSVDEYLAWKSSGFGLS